jgi:hypothetical protein
MRTSVLILAALSWSQTASAQCAQNASGITIDCNRNGAFGRLDQRSASNFATFPCGSRTQSGPEEVFELRCDRTEYVEVDIRDLDCDADVYVLPDTCDLANDDCVAFNEEPGAANFYQAEVLCTPGASFWVIVEGYNLGQAPTTCQRVPLGLFGSTRVTDFSLRAICGERCDDGISNDWDAEIDCDDTDCCGDAACSPTALCCDVDGDGQFADDPWCGGDDCDDGDPAVGPHVTDTPADGIDNDCDGVDDCFQDLDGDGFGGTAAIRGDDFDCTNGPNEADNPDDCLDLGAIAAIVYPGAPEIVGDGVDQDCDNRDTCWVDADLDGVGGSTSLRGPDLTCGDEPGLSTTTGDCVDQGVGADAIFPGADEICNGIDDDCDLAVDDADDDRVGGGTWYRDRDTDGFGDPLLTAVSCLAPDGFVGQADDCNDDPALAGGLVFPGADEVVGDTVDQDCDGGDACYVDGDGDGFGGPVVQGDSDLLCGNGDGLSSRGDDCLDVGPNAAVVFPGADEVCNGRDDDCDTFADDADDDTVGTPTWWFDADGDDFGAIGTAVVTCVGPPDHIQVGGDCDDARDDINPDAVEVCNGLDDDCDALVDDEDALPPDLQAWPDDDGDGWGDTSLPTDLAVCTLPDGFVSRPGDCADDDPSRNAGATEIPYDGVDQDCSGADLTDVDGDGVDGGPAGGDCVDTVATILPGAAEVFDGVDQDCDGLVDEGTEGFDDDGDGWAELGGDCDDDNPSIHPSAPEAGDARDQDCDGVVDEGTLLYDDDGDGYAESDGDCNDADAAIYPGAPAQPGMGVDADCAGGIDGADLDGDGYAPFGGDCDDNDASVSPAAVEVANGEDDDCDGTVDNGTPLFDDDGDGASEADGDCDDTDPLIGPAATEVLDNFVDDDCDGTVDEGGNHVDDDGDGWTDDGGDCDDTDPSVSPVGVEVGNEVDDDCDGLVDEGVDDADLDGWRAGGGDCDDANGWANPEAEEVCDGVDNDCDGDVDEGCIGREDEDTGEVVEEPGRGCAHGGGAGWFALLGLLGLRRRR